MATETADNIKLKEAIIEVSKLSPKDKERIHNKYYATVNTRNHIFRKYCWFGERFVFNVTCFEWILFFEFLARLVCKQEE